MIKFIFTEIQIFIHALAFFTRLPLPKFKFSLKRQKECLKLICSIGLLLGVIQAGSVFFLSKVFPLSVSILLGIILSFLLTGVMHEDGLADTFDALWGAANKEKQELIFKDSTLGTYGVISLVGIIFLKFESQKHLQELLYNTIIFASIYSRFLCVASIFLWKKKEHFQSKSSNLINNFSFKHLIANFIVLLIASFYLISLEDLIKVFGIFLITLLFNLFLKKKTNSIRGDILGAIQQFSETLTYLFFLLI